MVFVFGPLEALVETGFGDGEVVVRDTFVAVPE